MTMRIRFTVAERVFEGELNDSATARALMDRLPLTVQMSRWGDEYYGGIGENLGVGESPDAREAMQVGELAYWPVGNALCVFFGPTPASTSDAPRAASPVNPLGRLDGDLDSLKKLGSTVVATVKGM